MKTLKCIKAFNLWELTVTLILTMFIMTKLLNIVLNNTLKVEQIYLKWRQDRVQEIININHHASS